MIFDDLILGDCLFEYDGELAIGTPCAVNIGPSQYLKGIFHSYTTDEYCFKDCIYYMKNDDDITELWITHHYKPIHWVNRNSPIWATCRKIE